MLARPDRVEPLTRSLNASETAIRLIPVFLTSPGDHAEALAVRNAGYRPRTVEWESGPGDYAKKINAGFAAAVTEWTLLAADDLLFHSGWATEAIRVANETDACVIGTNDLGNGAVVAGRHSTHSLVRRDYGGCGTIDDPTRILHEQYDHCWVDNEFVETAQARGTFAAAPRSVVEHLHPVWGKAADDATYRKAQARFNEDRRLFLHRRRLWTRGNR